MKHFFDFYFLNNKELKKISKKSIINMIKKYFDQKSII